jgi:hypothetical protein
MTLVEVHMSMGYDALTEISPLQLMSSVQAVSVSKGIYLFSVREASPERLPQAANVPLPAVHVGLAPGIGTDEVELMPGHRANGTWLCDQGDNILVRVNDERATLVLTSVLRRDGEALSVSFEQIGTANGVTLPAPNGHERGVAASVRSATSARSGTPSDRPVRLRVTTHIRNRGDVEFVDASWVGRVAPGLWIEAFSVVPLNGASPGEIEYKALTANGIETPWISNGATCGTQGMGIPLVGFAVRGRARSGESPLICEYTGFFRSGATIGPVRNGAPCTSDVQGDALEGIQLQIRTKGPDERAEAPRTPRFDSLAPAASSDQSRRRSRAIKSAPTKTPRLEKDTGSALSVDTVAAVQPRPATSLTRRTKPMRGRTNPAKSVLAATSKRKKDERSANAGLNGTKPKGGKVLRRQLQLEPGLRASRGGR